MCKILRDIIGMSLTTFAGSAFYYLYVIPITDPHRKIKIIHIQHRCIIN